MKFLIKILFLFIFSVALNARASSILTNKEEPLEGKYYFTSYGHYFPFGYKAQTGDPNDLFSSVFKDALSSLEKKQGLAFAYKYFDNVTDAVIDMKTGNTQVFLGAFYATDSFSDFDFIFPAILNNPIHLMMLPSRITEVKKIDDLKNLRGAYLQNEMFSDYMMGVFSNLSLLPFEDPDEAYRKLLIGEIDFVLGSYYYQYPLILERGLQDYVTFSSKPLWNMPMFIALSKRIANKKNFEEHFRKLLASGVYKEKVLEHIKQRIKEKEEAYAGVVPPMYSKPQTENDLTPADERLKEKQQ